MYKPARNLGHAKDNVQIQIIQIQMVFSIAAQMLDYNKIKMKCTNSDVNVCCMLYQERMYGPNAPYYPS